MDPKFANMERFKNPFPPVPPPRSASKVTLAAQNDDKLSDWERPEKEEQPQKNDHGNHMEILGKLQSQVNRIESIMPHIVQSITNQKINPEALGLLEFHRDVDDIKWILNDLHSLALTGIPGLGAPDVNNRLKNVEKSVKMLESIQADPEFLLAVQKDIGMLAEKLEEWQRSVGALPGWQAKLENDINEEVGHIRLKLSKMQHVLHQSPIIKKIMEGNEFGEILLDYENQIGDHANTLRTHASRLSRVDTQLGSIKEHNKNVEDAVSGAHENQVKLLKQLEDVRKTQKILVVSLGVAGLSSLGYFGWKGISTAIKWFRNRKTRKLAVAPKNGPEMTQIRNGNIKKRSHAREFNVEDGLYMRTRFD